MTSRTKSDLPPGVVERNGKLYRDVEAVSEDGSTYTRHRPVSLDFNEAKALRYDYYHPELGWILEGYKLAKDRSPASIMADGSAGGQTPEPEDSITE